MDSVHQPNKIRFYVHFVLFLTFFLTMTPFTSKKSSKILLESSRSIPCNAINERHIDDTLDTPDMCICNCDHSWSIKAGQLPATPTHPIEITNTYPPTHPLSYPPLISILISIKSLQVILDFNQIAVVDMKVWISFETEITPIVGFKWLTCGGPRWGDKSAVSCLLIPT